MSMSKNPFGGGSRLAIVLLLAVIMVVPVQTAFSSVAHNNTAAPASESNILFEDNFESGNLDKWFVGRWNPKGTMAVTAAVSHTGQYSAHSQSDPSVNTAPYIYSFFEETNTVSMTHWIYLPYKSQEYENMRLLSAMSVDKPGGDISYRINAILSGDDYNLDISEREYSPESRNHGIAYDVYSLTPGVWHNITMNIYYRHFDIYVDGNEVYSGERYDERPVDSTLFGDIGGSSGCGGDVYLDDVVVRRIENRDENANISVSAVSLTPEHIVSGDSVSISATIAGDRDIHTSELSPGRTLFSDNFESGNLDKWYVGPWNSEGTMEVTDAVGHSGRYSAHSQSDPDVNTAPFICRDFNETNNLDITHWIYLPEKNQTYEGMALLRALSLNNGLKNVSSSSYNVMTTRNTYNLDVFLGDDNYGIDIRERELSPEEKETIVYNLYNLTPCEWHNITLHVEGISYSVLVDGSVIYTGNRFDDRPLNATLFGDWGGKGGCGGDAYLDDVVVRSLPTDSEILKHRAVNTTCNVSFYLDRISDENLIYRERNVSVPANGNITVNAPWTAVEGEHDIIVVADAVKPQDSNISNNVGRIHVSVLPRNTPPVAIARSWMAGYHGMYYNLPADHPDVGGSITGYVPGDSPFNHDWYSSKYFSFERMDSNLEFGDNFYPVNDGLPGDPHYFAVHWEAGIYVPQSGNYSFEMGSDDDSWLYIDDQMVMDLGGIHPMDIFNGSVYLNAGAHRLDIYFAERHLTDSGFYFRFMDDAVIPFYGDAYQSGGYSPGIMSVSHDPVISDPEIDTSTFYFDALQSYDPDGEIISYVWDFGDGITGEGEMAKHSYASAGTYNVTLTVTDNDGAVDRDNITVVVHTPAKLSISTKLTGPSTGYIMKYYEWKIVIEVANPGGSTALNVTVSDTLPKYIHVLNYTADAGNASIKYPGCGTRSTAYSPPSTDPFGEWNVEWNIAALAPGESAVLVINISTPECGFKTIGNHTLENGAEARAKDSMSMERISAGPTPSLKVIIYPYTFTPPTEPVSPMLRRQNDVHTPTLSYLIYALSLLAVAGTIMVKRRRRST